jgi:hypothetical protein
MIINALAERGKQTRSPSASEDPSAVLADA